MAGCSSSALKSAKPRSEDTCRGGPRSPPRLGLPDIAAIDMFVVATATFRVLYALIVLGHDRRIIIHFEVTQNPTQVWLSRQITDAFPWDTAPRYLLRDRDTSFGPAFRDRVKAIGIDEF
jgi:putative transposase